MQLSEAIAAAINELCRVNFYICLVGEPLEQRSWDKTSWEPLSIASYTFIMEIITELPSTPKFLGTNVEQV